MFFVSLILSVRCATKLASRSNRYFTVFFSLFFLIDRDRSYAVLLTDRKRRRFNGGSDTSSFWSVRRTGSEVSRRSMTTTIPPSVLIIGETTGTNSECRNYFIQIDRTAQSSDDLRRETVVIHEQISPSVWVTNNLLVRPLRPRINLSENNGCSSHFSSVI